jgi:maltose alpha-D-glucosyltransferase/alpha-amylase
MKILADYIKKRRWFRAKARGLAAATVAEDFTLSLAGEPVRFLVVQCSYASGPPDDYILPIATAKGGEAERLAKERPHLVIGPSGDGILYDALGSERLLASLLEAFRAGTRVESPNGTLVFRTLAPFAAAAPTSVEPKPVTTEQTNTSIVFGDGFILKVLRQLDRGVSADLEMGEFLTNHGYTGTPPVCGAVVIERREGPPTTVAILHRFAPNQGDAWNFTLKVLAASEDYLPYAALLGKRVGEMHAVLASGNEPAFVGEPLERATREKLADGVMQNAAAVAQWLSPGDETKIRARLDTFVALDEAPVGTRVHGDLHLGQILFTGQDFVLIDFEGEPARSLEERKAKHAPMKDVAGMLRSFHYAAATALRATDPEKAAAWYRGVADAFLGAYRDTVSTPARWQTVLDFYLLEKCIYEIAYEANNRPDWIGIPRDGLADLLAAERPA